MKAIIRAGCAVVLACALSPIQIAAAQPAYVGCSPENSTTTAQTLRCEGGVTIVAENGARYILQDRDGNGLAARGAEETECKKISGYYTTGDSGGARHEMGS